MDTRLSCTNQNVFTAQEEHTLKHLVRVLDKNGVPSAYYSLVGAREDNVCLEKNKNVWNVYIVERGKQNDKESYLSLRYAAYKIIRLLSESPSQYLQMISEFDQQEGQSAHTGTSNVASVSKAKKRRMELKEREKYYYRKGK